MAIPQEIIKSKRNGNALTEAEIKQFVQGLTDDSFSDSQAGCFFPGPAQFREQAAVAIAAEA